jgi:D-tyrosyl-tRNA(Tyr) deacylase
VRAAIQRVTEAAVRVAGETVGRIDKGLLVYLGVAPDDGDADVQYMVDKIRHLRIFPDAAGKMNLDVVQACGSVLVVSAFSLLADARQGRRPAFDGAAPPDLANRLYEQVCAVLSASVRVERGRFAAMMEVSSVNDGPIHVLLDSRRLF